MGNNFDFLNSQGSVETQSRWDGSHYHYI